MSQEIQDKPGGNTKTPGRDSTSQLYLWIITLKKEQDSTAEFLSQELRVFCKKFTFQLEKGEESGYLHWQIFISLKTKEYFKTVKNLFPSTAHIEACRNGWQASAYCSKSETRVEGPYDENSVFLKTISNLYPWQERIRLMCLKEPDDRTINWVWEPEGNKGKTSFCKYMYLNYKATILGNGAFKDIAQALSDSPKIVMFNITRDLEDRFNYSAVEAIKDGMVFSGKYESRMKVFNSPHIFIFANFEPKVDKMSLDRWNLIRI